MKCWLGKLGERLLAGLVIAIAFILFFLGGFVVALSVTGCALLPGAEDNQTRCAGGDGDVDGNTDEDTVVGTGSADS